MLYILITIILIIISIILRTDFSMLKSGDKYYFKVKSNIYTR